MAPKTNAICNTAGEQAQVARVLAGIWLGSFLASFLAGKLLGLAQTKPKGAKPVVMLGAKGDALRLGHDGGLVGLSGVFKFGWHDLACKQLMQCSKAAGTVINNLVHGFLSLSN
ncbi:MAG: hypothetical protein ABJJ53_05075 [Sulfitobacter sp.]